MPPEPLAVALPPACPKHVLFVMLVMKPLKAAAGWVMVTVRVVLHPEASVTVQVRLPTARPVAVAPVCTGLVFQLYV